MKLTSQVGTDRALQTVGESRQLFQHGVGAFLKRLVDLLRVLGVDERVKLLAERLLELGGVLLNVLQRRGSGRVAAHHGGLAL